MAEADPLELWTVGNPNGELRLVTLLQIYPEPQPGTGARFQLRTLGLYSFRPRQNTLYVPLAQRQPVRRRDWLPYPQPPRSSGAWGIAFHKAVRYYRGFMGVWLPLPGTIHVDYGNSDSQTFIPIIPFDCWAAWCHRAVGNGEQPHPGNYAVAVFSGQGPLHLVGRLSVPARARGDLFHGLALLNRCPGCGQRESLSRPPFGCEPCGHTVCQDCLALQLQRGRYHWVDRIWVTRMHVRSKADVVRCLACGECVHTVSCVGGAAWIYGILQSMVMEPRPPLPGADDPGEGPSGVATVADDPGEGPSGVATVADDPGEGPSGVAGPATPSTVTASGGDSEYVPGSDEEEDDSDEEPEPAPSSCSDAYAPSDGPEEAPPRTPGMEAESEASEEESSEEEEGSEALSSELEQPPRTPGAESSAATTSEEEDSEWERSEACTSGDTTTGASESDDTDEDY